MLVCSSVTWMRTVLYKVLTVSGVRVAMWQDFGEDTYRYALKASGTILSQKTEFGVVQFLLMLWGCSLKFWTYRIWTLGWLFQDTSCCRQRGNACRCRKRSGTTDKEIIRGQTVLDNTSRVFVYASVFLLLSSRHLYWILVYFSRNSWSFLAFLLKAWKRGWLFTGFYTTCNLDRWNQ